MRRAAHQLIDRPVVFDDPLALRIIGPALAAALLRDLTSYETNQSVRRRRAFLVARSRYAEDQLAAALERGVRQYLVLGAGLDTSAYRVAAQVPPLRIFEVDHPATQAWKQERLSEATIAIPNTLTFAPIDFAEQSLRDGLVGAGFDFNAPAFVSWLGVSMYLPANVVIGVLRTLAALPAGSVVVFDFVRPSGWLNIWHRFLRFRRTRRLAQAGEPWLSEFESAPLTAQLRELGYGRIEDLDRSAMNRRYFANRTDDLKVGGHSDVLALFR